jgi:hypothetical protein
VVVDFAVKYNSDLRVFCKDGLISRIQVDDLQSRRAHGKKAGLIYPLLIWPAVDQGIRGFLDPFGRGGPILIRKSDYAAQIPTPLAAKAGGLFLRYSCSLKTCEKNAINSLRPNLRLSTTALKTFNGTSLI